MVYLQRWHGWCHMKLQPSRRKFCVHHTTMHHVTSCKATYVRCILLWKNNNINKQQQQKPCTKERRKTKKLKSLITCNMFILLFLFLTGSVFNSQTEIVSVQIQRSLYTVEVVTKVWFKEFSFLCCLGKGKEILHGIRWSLSGAWSIMMSQSVLKASASHTSVCVTATEVYMRRKNNIFK